MRDDRSGRRPSVGLNRGVHGLRGLAALMVVFAHILGGTADHVYFADASYVAAITPFWNLGVFFVYVFFAISGYVIVPSIITHAPGDFALRRFVRIYPLFFAMSVVFIVGNGILDLQPKLNDPGTIVAALFFVNLFTGTDQLTPNAWSLSYEVVFYVAVGLMAWAVRRESVAIGAATAVAGAAFVVAFPGAIYFLIGAAAYLIERRGWLDALGTPLCRCIEAAGAVFVAWAGAHEFYAYAMADVLSPGAQRAILSVAIYFPFAVRRDSLTTLLLSGRAAQFLGTISYSLYLVHPYVYLPLRMAFSKAGLFGPDPLPSLLGFGAVVVALSIAASTVSWRVFEVWPQRLVRRGRAPATAAGEQPRWSGAPGGTLATHREAST